MLHTIARQFNAGGPFMWVLLIVLAISCAVVIERLIFYFLLCPQNSVKMVAEAIKSLNGGKHEEAMKIIKKKRAPVNVLLQAALERFNAGMKHADVQEGIEESAIKEMPRMPQRLNYLSLFANIATLLGLLGTVSGLQTSFSSISAVEASQKASMLAKGIAEAMNCTAFGLLVAVPCMIMYTVLYNKNQQLTKDLDEAVVRLMNYFKKKEA